jgi:hypothetical protein
VKHIVDLDPKAGHTADQRRAAASRSAGTRVNRSRSLGATARLVGAGGAAAGLAHAGATVGVVEKAWQAEFSGRQGFLSVCSRVVVAVLTGPHLADALR